MYKKSKEEVKKVILRRLFEGNNLTQARKGIFSEHGFKYLAKKWQKEGIFVLEVVDKSKRAVFTDKGVEFLKEKGVIR